MEQRDDRSDAELLRAASRDAEAFGVFFDRHRDAIHRYFLRRTADAWLASELTAETFAEAFASRRRYRKTDAKATSWLYTIAARQLTEFWRQERVSRKYRGRLGMTAPSASDDAFARVEELADASALFGALESALGSLSAASADAVMMRIGHGWSYHDVASHLGCSPATARVRVSRSLHQLAQQLEPSARGDHHEPRHDRNR